MIDGTRRPILAFAAPCLIIVLLTAVVTWPQCLHMGTRVGAHDDPQFSIWRLAWVAHSLATDPRHLFDANIFWPHRDALAYSENNLGAGALAIPVYWASRNPYAAHNFVVIVGFFLTLCTTYSLVRYLTGDWREEVVWRESDSSALRLYTTTNVTTRRIYTLMHDAQYRMAVSWQNGAYNQPPHTSFAIGSGMAAPPIPNITIK